MLQPKYPFVKIPKEIDIVLFLIKEELKTRKLFNTLNQIGLGDCEYEPHLDKLIMNLLDIDDGTDQTFGIYFEIIERRSHKIKDSGESAIKQAIKAHNELLTLRKELKKKTKA